MPKSAVSDWDTVAANNTDIGGISIAEGCAMANLNNAMREMMAQIKTEGFISAATTVTLTNKRITPRVTTITSSGTPTVNTDNCDFVNITALAAAITSMTTNLTGTPTIGDVLVFQIKDNGTARAITWGASFTAKGVALPTTTVLSKLLTVAFLWNGTNWGCVGSTQET